jgi:mono/diheme cytochrome c family protein
MGRTGKLLLMTLMLVACLAAGGGHLARLTRAEAGAQKKPTGKQLAAAKVLYTQKCARCHGADGRAATLMGESFRATKFADAEWWKKERPSNARLTTSIRDGRGNMRPFGQDLSKKEIAALAAYVRTFNGK